MMFQRLLVGLVEFSRRRALLVLIVSLALAAFSGWYASGHLGVSTDTDKMFASSLPWRQRSEAFGRAFPQFSEVLAIVIDARETEAAEATAAALATALAADHAHFRSVRRPDASPFLAREGLLFLDQKQLEHLLNGTIDAQPFLGQLVADPSARGLFASLALLGMGAQQGQADLGPFTSAMEGFHQVMADALAGHPQPLSWSKLLGGGVSDLAGRYKFVLVQPILDYGTLSPGAAATNAIRTAASELEFVKTGDARVRITGNVALADEEFASVAQGAVEGMIVSLVLITIWLFLAVRSWRLIVPILLTLGLGLMLTLLFASVAVGTLNLVSVGFGILFVGIAVDFAIQFSVRYRGMRLRYADADVAMTETGRRVGTANPRRGGGHGGRLPRLRADGLQGRRRAWPYRGRRHVDRLRLHAAVPAGGDHPVPAAREAASIGFTWGERMDREIARIRVPVLAVFAALAVLGGVLLPRLTFNSDPLHTKNPNTEAMRTLYDLMDSPVTNPFTIDILEPNAAEAARLAEALNKLPLVDNVITVNSFVPPDQPAKLALIADAATILGPTLAPHDPAAPVTPDQIRMAAGTALQQIQLALPKLPADSPLVAIASDLRGLSAAPDAVVVAADQALTRFLPMQLAQLRTALEARPVTLADLPPDITRDWLLPDGRARIQVVPKPEARNSAGLRRFVEQVIAVAPDAGGSAVTIEATSDTIIRSFRKAAIGALVAITVILFVALRRVLDVALVLAPLLLSSLMTVILAVLLPMPLNYANIIALPLLLGVGVSFNVYFVMNWRAGRLDVLGSPTARAILFSALTTATAFGSLALSGHPGTASMGELLLVSLGCTLVASLAFLPALLASVPRPPTAR